MWLGEVSRVSVHSAAAQAERPRRRWVDVEMLVATIGVIGSVVVALLARLTGLTQDDRRRARVLRDAELWKALPKSDAREALEEHIASATTSLLAERQADRRFARLWAVGAWFAFGAWVLLLVFSAVPSDPYGVDPQPFWIDQTRQALYIASWVSGALAVAFWILAIWFGGRRAWAWAMAKFRRSHSKDERSAATSEAGRGRQGVRGS